MTTPNHIVGGFVITGIFGSFMNINILASPWYILTAIIASVLPDIDHTRSIIGKIFLPFSRFINRRFGHRTITHSLIVLLGTSLVAAYLEITFFHSSQFTKIYFLGFSSHLILDMMTVQGVPLFYPFLKNPCVLPGNPDMRFRTGNLRTETMVFSFFLLSAIFLQPLFKNGFWTQYNRFFGTPKHLASEFRKSDDALLVKYIVKKGTEEIRGEGICLEATGSKIMLLEDGRFHELNKTKYSIREVIPEHTGQSLHFEQISFMNISIDSLNTLVNAVPIQKIEVQSSNDFAIHHNNIQEVRKEFKMEYPSKVWFQEIVVPVSKETFTTFSNPRIQTLRNQVEMLRSQNRSAIDEYQKVEKELADLKSEYARESDIVMKERLLKRIKALEKVKAPKTDERKIRELQLKMEELMLADRIKDLERRQEVEREYLESLSTHTKLSGFLTRIVIYSSPMAYLFERRPSAPGVE